MTAPLEYDVIHETASGRYEARARDGQPEGGRAVGVLQYERFDGVVVVASTVTDPEFRGNGVASALTRRALDDARDAGLRVRAECWYVDEWIDRNPEYAGLRA
jgi:predicted GNAT family acetyltransferase